jgi:hypothetical protein
VGELSDALRFLFNALEAKASTLDQTGAQSVSLASSTGLCVNGTSAQPLLDGATTLKANTQDTLDLVEGLGPTTGNVGDLFKDRIPYLLDWGIGLVTAFMALTVFFGLWSVACGSTFRQKLMIAFSVIVLTVLCPLIAFELTLSVVISDFCIGLENGEEEEEEEEKEEKEKEEGIKPFSLAEESSSPILFLGLIVCALHLHFVLYIRPAPSLPHTQHTRYCFLSFNHHNNSSLRHDASQSSS